ncbi:MAG: FAD-binding domain-containing protein [Pseudomonadota bacterium]
MTAPGSSAHEIRIQAAGRGEALAMQDDSTPQVVWFKRDLRIHDHRPLTEATRSGGPVLPLYVCEPEQWLQADRSARHVAVTSQALSDLDAQLRRLGSRLIVYPGETLPALQRLREHLGTFVLWAHEETGNGWTYQRDLSVIEWCREHHIPFCEHPQFGVTRVLGQRDGWAGRWNRQMAESLTAPPRRLPALSIPSGFRGIEAFTERAEVLPEAMQRVGRRVAVGDLESFLRGRAEGYRKHMSSPRTAERGGSRLSVHLSLGTLAMREVWQATTHRRRQLLAKPPERRGTLDEDLKAFEGRLHWHCHFIQKLESSPAIEFHNMSASVDGLREEAEPDEARLRAWREGLTGYPYLDACMRYLNCTGWLNFRARAMLMSFAAYDLWLHWREPALHLARLFLDYEPGIHYSQVQMQSGTTGINTLRISNPVKQGQDHDPEGEFIGRWVPELAGLPGPARHTPWTASPIEQASAGVVLGRDYPHRVVDHVEAARAAQVAIRARRREPQARAEAATIHQRHGSRRRRN